MPPPVWVPNLDEDTEDEVGGTGRRSLSMPVGNERNAKHLLPLCTGVGGGHHCGLSDTTRALLSVVTSAGNAVLRSPINTGCTCTRRLIVV